MSGDFALAWDVLQPLIVLGFTIGVVLAVVFASIRFGIKHATWIVIASLLIWFFS